MKKSNWGFFSNYGDVTLRLMIQSCQFSNWSKILSYLICKFQEDLIKTDQVTPITKSYSGFFKQ